MATAVVFFLFFFLFFIRCNKEDIFLFTSSHELRKKTTPF